jgi:hypothetical protein
MRGVRGDARDHALEGQRPAWAQTESKPVGSGIEAGVEGGVALQGGEGAEAAVLLGGDRHEDDLGLRAAGARHLGQRVQAAAAAPLHVDAAAAVQPAVLHGAPTTARGARAPCPRGRRRRARRWPGDRRQDCRRRSTVSPHSSSRGASSPGWSRARAAPARSCSCRIGAQAEGLGERGEPLEDAALVAGDARDLHERGRVGGQRPRVDHGVASSVARLGLLGGHASASAAPALVSARA